MPGAKSKHITKWDRCVKKVKEKSPNVNPYAICSSSIEDAGLKKKHQKRSKSGYYANRKRGLTKEEFITKFNDFANEDVHYMDREESSFMRQEQEEGEYYAKAKELLDKFTSDNEPGDYDKEFIINWLKENNEPELFADIIKQELDSL